MASQWNDEFLTHFGPVVQESRTLSTDGGDRRLIIRATDGGFVQMNNHPLEMPELDLYMPNDHLAKTGDMCVPSEPPIHHTQHSSGHDDFDSHTLGLVASDASLLIHPDHADLEASHLSTSPGHQLQDLVSVSQCLSSLGSSLDVQVSEPLLKNFQPQHLPLETQHHVAILEASGDHQQQHPNHHHHHHHLHQHLEHQHLQEEQQDGHTPDRMLLTPALNSHTALAEQDHSSPSPLHLQTQTQNKQKMGVGSLHPVSHNQIPSSLALQNPLTSFHIRKGMLEATDLDPKVAALHQELSTKSNQCNLSYHHQPSNSFSFLQPNQSVRMEAPVGVTWSKGLDAAFNLNSNPVASTNVNVKGGGGKAKKQKVSEKMSSDMVWLNNKSVETRQRDRQATQVLISIVSQPKWQLKLNSPSVKKKSVWHDIGEEFITFGYFLENPGKKCFQKWRNLERSFKEYELNKSTPSSSSAAKSLPDFYEELLPILREKHSLDKLVDDNGKKQDGAVDSSLMEKYVLYDDDYGDSDLPTNRDNVTDINACPISSQNAASERLGDAKKADGHTVADPHHRAAGNNFSSGRENVAKTKTVLKKKTVVKRKNVNKAGRSSYEELLVSVSEGVNTQQEDLSQIKSAVLSIKELLEGQRKEREDSNAESKSRFLELKALIDRNQKEKMAFMYEFLKSVRNNQHHPNGEKS